MIENVLYVLGGEKASGAEIVMERLIEHSNYQSHLFIAPGDFCDMLIEKKGFYRINIIKQLKRLNRSNSSGLIFYILAIYNCFLISFKVYRYIRKHKIDIVHSNIIGPASYLLPLVIISPVISPNVKWVWTDHDLKYYFALDSFFSELCLKFYHITFAVSEAVKKKYLPSTKPVVLYNGLDCNFFKPDAALRESFRKKINIDNSKIVIGIAGVIAPRKGQLQLIQAFNKISHSFNIHLVLAGRFGDDSPTYCADVRVLVNSPNISYLGHITTGMVPFFNGCDIVVNNSNISGSEPLGTTIYEAMACGKIVIVSNTGGNPEIVDNNINGYIYEAENLDSLVNCLSNVLNSYSNFEKIRIAAREKIIEKFNIDDMSSNYRKYLTTY